MKGEVHKLTQKPIAEFEGNSVCRDFQRTGVKIKTCQRKCYNLKNTSPFKDHHSKFKIQHSSFISNG